MRRTYDNVNLLIISVDALYKIMYNTIRVDSSEISKLPLSETPIDDKLNILLLVRILC